jgi:hypothetical protein
MELAHFDEQSCQLELHTYQTTFHDFKYKPLNFVYVEIGTDNKVLATPFVVQPTVITKRISPPKSGQVLKSYPYMFRLLLYMFQLPLWSVNSGKVVKDLIRNMLNLLILHSPC